MTALTCFHGSGRDIGIGDKLSPSDDGFVYLAHTERWADAFAFRDRASHALGEAVVQSVIDQAPPDLAACRVNGIVYTVAVDGHTEPDPDFRSAPESARTAHRATVTHCTAGSITSWRDFCDWLQWGYPAEVFRRLGRWFPREGIYEIPSERTLLVMNELSVRLAMPLLPELTVPALAKVNAVAHLTDQNADYANSHWWL